MTDVSTRQLRVLHIVSSGGIAPALQPSLFLPLLTRLPKQRVKAQVISLAPSCVRAAMLRQNGIPVHDIALSRFRFSAGAMREVRRTVQKFRPDIIQAWGHTALIVSTSARKRCDWEPHVIWSVADTAPLPKRAGFIDRQKLKFAVKHSARADRIVYTSEASAAHHRRVGFPEGGHETIAPGVDAARFKPDPAVRAKVRDNLKLPADAFVIGMVAPFQPEYDHATFLKGIGELIKTNPHLYVLLAGHGVQRGNAPLMAMLGGGTLATRTQLLGEWSDLASLFNACDLVCSSALTDSARMTLAMAMLCSVPCVATGIGAQGELIGQHGVAIEPGSAPAFVRGIGKILEMPQDKRAQLAHGARKYALKSFVYVSSLQKYLKLYCELVGRDAPITEAAPAPAVEVAPAVVPSIPQPVAPKDHVTTIAELVDPDSLEAKVAPKEPEPLPKWRIEQEQERAKQNAQLSGTASSSEGDVLQIFEMELAKPAVKTASPMSERARGYVEDFEELLSPEVLTAPAASEPPVEPQPNAASTSVTPPNALPPQVAVASTTPVVTNEQAEPARADVQPPGVQERDEAPAPSATTMSAGTAPQRVETRSEHAPPQAVVGASSGAVTSTAAQSSDMAPAVQEASSASSAREPEIDTEATPAPASPSTSPDAVHTTAGMDSEPKQECLFDFEPMPELGKKAIGDRG